MGRARWWWSVGCALWLPVTAAAQDWGDYGAAFAPAPCQDGWTGCTVGDDRIDAEPVRDRAGLPTPSDVRLGWFDLEPTPAFSPFTRFVEVDGPTNEEPQPRPVATTRPALPETPVQQPAALDVQPTGHVEPEDHDDDDAVAVVELPVPPLVEVQSGCDDLESLEPRALLGRLTDAHRTCLEAHVVAGDSMTERGDASRVLIIDAHGRGDQSGWERLVQRHLLELDQSDPNLCYALALSLSQDATRAADVIRWSEIALENRIVWTGDTYVSRVFGLNRLRAAAAQRLWQAAEEAHAVSPSAESSARVERTRALTKVYSREWLEYAREAGEDAHTAEALCRSAAGTHGYCAP